MLYLDRLPLEGLHLLAQILICLQWEEGNDNVQKCGNEYFLNWSQLLLLLQQLISKVQCVIFKYKNIDTFKSVLAVQ